MFQTDADHSAARLERCASHSGLAALGNPAVTGSTLKGGGFRLPQERLSMHKIKTVLRLAGLGLSQRQIAVSCQIGQATVSDYLRMASGRTQVARHRRLGRGPAEKRAGACLDPGAELAQDRRPRLRRDPA